MEVFKQWILSKQEEAALTFEYGQTGLGAKVYGFFKTEDGTLGRIDEFIDARTLEPEDVEDAETRRDIARGMARFHTLEGSYLVGKEGPEVKGFYEALRQGLNRHQGSEHLKEIGRRAGVDIDHLIDYDFATAVNKVVRHLESINAKKGRCIHDVQYGNILVRKRPKPDESKTVLIDFEFATQNYRGFDIGEHFMQKMFKWYDEGSKVVDCREYSEEERRDFCEEYARVWNERTGDLDTGEDVLAEAEFGVLLAVVFDVHNMLCAMGEGSGGDLLSLVGLKGLFGEFVRQFGKLGL